MVIRGTSRTNSALLLMAKKMWPDLKPSDLRPGYTFYIAENGNELVGFILLSIRRDYVPGSTTFPVGYVEGIYVKRKLRKTGVGHQLIQAAEQWCRKKGFKELGSDVEPGNKVSQRFHSGVGFKKEKLVVPYIKKVRPGKSGRT